MRGQIDERYEYQQEIIDHLVQKNGYVKRDHCNFDKKYALDRELLFEFLKDTQADTLTELAKIFGDDLEETIINTINNFVISEKGSLLSALKQGVDINNKHLTLLYGKPATSFNPELSKLYGENIFSVMEEVYADEANKERVDLVIFINGFAVISFELKSNSQGQNYENAIRQYRIDRDPKNRLFRFKTGCLVNFAMDTEEVYMTTQLNKEKTFFLPFNMGKGEGVNSGAGNPIFDNKYSVSYMWEDILQKDTLVELITKFIFIESKEVTDQITGKKKIKERIIFPRYHQLDVIRKTLADLKINKTSQNYLIQHSAGSGKTNSIAWLAHRLASLHDEDDKVIFDNVIIMTDRVVVDRQLQKAIMGLEHKAGLIRVMDDKCTSADLKLALESNTKIVVTTIQKFPHVVELIKDESNQSGVTLKNKKFAVIIDEAHSSTAGKDMLAVTSSLSSTANFYEQDVQDQLVQEIQGAGKQKNVSMFAFTATPKPTTLRLFGRLDKHGNYRAFHLYSMRQAIEEGFILDVLANYTTYETYYELNKEIADDPELKTVDAKRQIAQQIDLDETNIAQRTKIIIEHFRQHVMTELGDQAKAIVITASRKAAVKYQQAFQKYIEDHNYNDVGVLVAFSGKVKLDDESEFTEASLNGISEYRTAREFNKEGYRFLLVANKYQVGFDQPKLTALRVKLISIDVLVSLAVIGAFIIGEFNEAAIVTWLFMLGDVLEELTLKKTRSAVADLTKMAPKTALVVQDDGSTEKEDVDFIDPGEKILVKTGDQVPVDGKVISGSGYLNEASVNGESKLVNKKAGNEVYAGTILENGTLTVETTAVGEDTTFGKIIEMVEEAQDTKSHTEKLINRFSQYYTPAVLVIAIAVGLITKDLKLAITVMVLGCPGALVIGVPVSTVAGIGNGAKSGIMFKGSQVMDQTHRIDEIAFDKTGTLTVGHPEVSAIEVLNGSKDEIIKLAAQIERQSNHPLAQAIAKLNKQNPASIKVETVKGKGIIAILNNQKYYLGNQDLIVENTRTNAKLDKTINHLSQLGNSIVVFANEDQSQLAVFGIEDQLRPEANDALTRLKELGVKKLVMLSGDNQETAERIAAKLSIDEVHGQMLPQDKAAFVKKERAKGHHIAFVGDGINDSPALANANVAIAVGSGTDVAIEVSDIVLVKNDLRKIAYALGLSKKTILNMNENIVMALLTVLLLFIGLFTGYVEMASGMFIHEFSILIVILNGMRLIKFQQKIDDHQVYNQQNKVSLDM